jgi:hypothetical protein
MAKKEEFKIDGHELIAKVKQLIREGNARRIIIKDESGKSLIEIPLTIGAIGAVLVPVFAAVGAVAALVTKCTIVVEKNDEK